MKKYLVLARGLNEPDNNTPSDEILAKVVDIEPTEVAKYEKVITDDLNSDYEHGVVVQIIPIEELQDEWRGVFDIW